MKTWNKKGLSVELLRRLNESYNIDYITASLMARRGIVEAKAVQYVLESDISYQHNPFLFEEMELFVERILEAQQEQEKIFVFGDRDVDGIVSTVLFVQEFTSMGFEVFWAVPEGDDPYGLTKEAIDSAHQQGATLIVTVDCGISHHEEVAYAQTLGIDVLITDHHLSGDTLPAALAIIDPKVEGSEYPFAHLAGCGVVAKSIWALRFAQTDFYGQELILFHAYPGKDTIIMEAVRMRNLLEVDRMVEEIVPGTLVLHQSRMIQFLDSQLPIFALDVPTVKSNMNKLFGNEVEIHMAELRSEFETFLPAVKSRGLFALKNMSRALTYIEQPTELDALISLFNAYVYRKERSLSYEYESLLDLVALGTIGDLMPMEDEHRLLVKKGLLVLEEGRRKNLLSLMSMQQLIGKRLGTSDISWNLTPVINSSGRMGKPSVAVHMLLAETLPESETYARQLIQLNKERQKQGDDVWDRLLPKAKKSYEEFDNKFLYVEDRTLQRGLTGIMASRLLRHFQCPSLVLANIDDQRITASMRSPSHFNVRTFLSQFEHLFTDFGGHHSAAGFSMEQQHLTSLKEQLVEAVKHIDESDIPASEIEIDAELTSEYLNPDIIQLVELFEPYGEGNAPLQFLIQQADVQQVQYLPNRGSGPSHVKLLLRFGSYSWPALYWNGEHSITGVIEEGDEVDVVFRMGRNYWKQSETLQLTIVDIRKHKTPIEKIMRLS